MSIGYDIASGNQDFLQRDRDFDFDEGCGDDAIIAVAEGQKLIAFGIVVLVAYSLGLFLAGFLVGLMF